MTTSRVQAGVPTCGQFTPSAHAEAGIALDARPGLEQTGQDRPENADVGADPKDTDEWEDQGLEQSEAAEFTEAGIEVAEAAAWRSEGFNAGEAAAWDNQGFDSTDAALYQPNHILNCQHCGTWNRNQRRDRIILLIGNHVVEDVDATGSWRSPTGFALIEVSDTRRRRCSQARLA